MGINSTCPRCKSHMIDPRYNDEPMYCLVCGAQGDMPPTTTNVHTIKTRTSTTHTARYRSYSSWPGNNKLKQLTVKYRMTFATPQGINPMPALILECPWCGGVTKSQVWTARSKLVGDKYSERAMNIVCPSKHSYSIVCNEEGDYYWR